MESELYPLAEIGQELRREGLALEMRPLRRAIEDGRAAAERRGRQWYVTIETARRFSKPIELEQAA